MRLLIFSVLALLCSFKVQSAATLKLQYAGEVGLLAIGAGKQYESGYSFSVLYGMLPEEIAGNLIETYAFKNQMRFIDFNLIDLRIVSYFGVSLQHVSGKNLNSGQSKSYPRNYYALTSWRGLLYWGVEIVKRDHKDAFKKGLFIESAINDIWLVNYLNNREQVNINKYITLALGLNYYFY